MSDKLAALYTPIDTAVAELCERRSRLSKIPTDPLFARLLSGNYAVLWRHIASPNFESVRFSSLATFAGLSPILLEFHGDRFVTRNPLKCALLRLNFSDGPESAGGNIGQLSIADMTVSEGRMFRELTTVQGKPLVQFHHELLKSVPEFAAIDTLDISDWFRASGETIQQRYTAFFCLFANAAILFEDFLLTPQEERFTCDVAIPAFEAARARCDCQPLICRTVSIESASLSSWFHYPRELLPFVRGRFHPPK